MPFAREFCDMLEDLKATRAGQPEALAGGYPPATELFQQMEFADRTIWKHCQLAKVFNYLRRNKKLQIPAEWQGLVPDLLPEYAEG